MQTFTFIRSNHDFAKKNLTHCPHDSGRCDKNAELKRKTENMLKHDLRIMPAESIRKTATIKLNRKLFYIEITFIALTLGSI